MLYDVIVVGSGISGLYAALYARKSGLNVAVLTKSSPLRSNSAVASGGINATLDAQDTQAIKRHIEDTLAGGDGLGHAYVIEQMCKHAPELIEELRALGVAFDLTPQGEVSQRPFGGTKAVRTCYVADKTGAAITMKLLGACKEEGVEILANHFFMNMTFFKGELSGVTVLKRDNSDVVAMPCKALILSGGGYAGIYRGFTTNASESNGDTQAAALRAGMRLQNMEFVQFHPTTLKHKAILISEASRGEGARIVDEKGEAFVDPLLTRDKLSRAIIEHEEKGHEVYLDFRLIDKERIDAKLPSTKKTMLASAGIDITQELVPIEPAAHYTMGGIFTKSDTSTDISKVFACGECASSGVHGANRLGGNSLLEAAYFGSLAGLQAARVAKRATFLPIDYDDIEKENRMVELIMEGENRYNVVSMRKNLGAMMFKQAGIFRTQSGLLDVLDYIHYLMQKSFSLHCINKERENNVELLAILEFHNALLIAESVVMSALSRKESRGAHYRSDYPAKNDKSFQRDTFISLLNHNYFKVTFETVSPHGLFFKLKKLFH